MKKVLIIGATGSLAEYVIQEAEKNEELELTLFARDTGRLPVANLDEFTIIEGDALNYDQVKQAVHGQDIVYVNLAGDLATMGENIVQAMHEMGVKRVIAICSIGIYDKPLKAVLTPYRALADIVETSGLDYTILRPDWFTFGTEVDYGLTVKGEPEIGGALSRKSIADFVVSVFNKPETYVNQNLGISKQ
jgi:uncharacterized protein YbjT (DUF2867 family)